MFIACRSFSLNTHGDLPPWRTGERPDLASDLHCAELGGKRAVAARCCHAVADDAGRGPVLICALSPAQAVCDCVPAGFFDVLTWLGYCNSTMNPIIYPLFMRDFKRAMAKYLPCCRHSWEGRPSAISLSMRNSNSGPRLGMSLRNVLTLQGETDSVDSVIQVNEHLLLPACKDPHLESIPATGADSVNLFDLEHMDQELQINQLNTPMD